MTQTFTITLPAERASKHDSIVVGVQFAGGVATAELSPNQHGYFVQYGATVEVAADPDGTPLQKLTKTKLKEYADAAEPPIDLAGAVTRQQILDRIEAVTLERETPAEGVPVEPVIDVTEPAAGDDEEPVVTVTAE